MKYSFKFIEQLMKWTSRLLGVCLLMMSTASISYADNAVTLAEDAETYTMDNGIVTVRVSKVTGDLVSFRYKNMELFETNRPADFVPKVTGQEPGNNPNWQAPTITGSQHGYWSHNVQGVRGSAPAIPSVTINPATNGGALAEVSLKAISKGRKMGTGPGAAAGGNLAVDVEIRYTLERGASGVYTYCIFKHPADYPAGEFTEARYCAKLADFFDWISVGADVNRHYPKSLHEGDKYIYAVNQTDNSTFGWSSTTKGVGLFFINPSMEYMSGGPTKVELLGHRNTDAVAAPCVLNYWRSSHYGGAEANIAEGEEWTKVIGPFLIYANAGNNPNAIYQDALSKGNEEAAKWPYNWVENVDYPKAKARGVVKGKLVLRDVTATAKFSNLNVGLTAGEYVSPRIAPGPEVKTGWQRDAKFYQFWTKGNADGTFTIPKVRPGDYTLYAFTDGVLGEFVKATIKVEAGKVLNLGELVWTPVRYGRQIWDIGVPNRSPSEFNSANRFRDPAISLEYPKLFPNDVNYVMGQSNYAKDWFFQHIPHNKDTAARPSPYRGIIGAPGTATPYTIQFDLPNAPTGNASLRFAICGTGTRSVDVEVNGKNAGKLENLVTDGAITRHGKQGIWYEKTLGFNASLMHKGTNILKIIVPAGSVNNGLLYDYLRLELDEKGHLGKLKGSN